MFSASTDLPHEAVQPEQGVSSIFSVAQWVVRLHLAQYCITGAFPTILHRVLGLRLERDTTIIEKVPLRPTTDRLIGALIGLQASAALSRYFVNWWTKKVATFLERTDRRRSPGRLTPDDLFVTASSDSSVGTASNNRSTLCSICRTERRHPAAPSSCGHVCCWNCLMQWVSTVRSECPLCRAACRPQDILPLYNYEP